jgi:hemerythrin-like domain-containing protein
MCERCYQPLDPCAPLRELHQRLRETLDSFNRQAFRAVAQPNWTRDAERLIALVHHLHRVAAELEEGFLFPHVATLPGASEAISAARAEHSRLMQRLISIRDALRVALIEDSAERRREVCKLVRSFAALEDQHFEAEDEHIFRAAASLPEGLCAVLNVELGIRVDGETRGASVAHAAGA